MVILFLVSNNDNDNCHLVGEIRRNMNLSAAGGYHWPESRLTWQLTDFALSLKISVGLSYNIQLCYIPHRSIHPCRVKRCPYLCRVLILASYAKLPSSGKLKQPMKNSIIPDEMWIIAKSPVIRRDSHEQHFVSRAYLLAKERERGGEHRKRTARLCCRVWLMCKLSA